MAVGENSSWDKIQQGVKDTERLIVQREYNASMIKARQTLEFMVKNLADQAGIIDNSDLKDMIDALYEKRWISKATCEHYHKIRMIGNKAVHEGDANAYSANQAYHMLSQEVYTFTDDNRNAKKGRKPFTKPVKVQGSSESRTGAGGEKSAEISQADHTDSSYSGNRADGSYGEKRSSSSMAARSRKRSRSQSFSVSLYTVLKILVPVLCIVLLILVFKLAKMESGTEKTESSAAVETMESTKGEQQEMENGEPVYRTTDVLNVRPEPSTSSERIGQLNAGVAVEYVRAYDDDWAVILYNGQEAYVASQYLTTR